jgi:predicted N-acyltransferase
MIEIGSSRLEVRASGSLAEVPAEAWDALAPAHFPFADHAYLSALETSGSVGEGTGWKPIYWTCWLGRELVGALYAYLKRDSYGEYIFDWAWLRAYQQAGVPYFPKLVAAVPFTPATGPKILVHPLADAAAVRARLIEAMRRAAGESRASSIHLLFLTPEEASSFGGPDWLLRHSYQFHWRNRSYRDFGSFLGALKSRKRTQILAEREQVARSGISIEVVEGDRVTGDHARAMYRFYLSTIEKMGAIAYLTPAFFDTVFDRMRGAIVLMLARSGGRPVAGALNYRKGDALFGRYWGCTEEIRGLHFELCYYQGIEYAIARGLRLFEAGAQGEHKLARGFLPALTYSAHWIHHPVFREAIADYIGREKAAIAEAFEAYAAQSPFRAD